MDRLPPDLPPSFWTTLGARLQPADDPSGRLMIGKQGVYLIDRGAKVSRFALVPWEKVVSHVPPPDAASSDAR